MLNRCFALLALAGLLMVQPALAAAQDAAGPIVAIYKKAAAGKGDSGGQFVWLEKKDRPRWLSKSLTALWNAEEAKTPKGDQPPPGFDPVSDSQDPLVRNVKVAVEKNDGKRATVAASFDSWPSGNTVGQQRANPPERVTVRYDMVLERGRWKIDGIRGGTGDKPWSIRAILKHFNGD